MKIKIDKRYRLEKAVSKDENRVALQYVKIEGNRAIATDGHILADIPIKRGKFGKRNFLLKSESWKKLVAKEKKDYEIELDVSGFAEKPPISYPNWKKVVPDGSSHKFEFGINAKFLYSLSQALGEDRVKLSIDQSSSEVAILVEPMVDFGEDSRGEKGLIMPVRIESK